MTRYQILFFCWSLSLDMGLEAEPYDWMPLLLLQEKKSSLMALAVGVTRRVTSLLSLQARG